MSYETKMLRKDCTAAEKMVIVSKIGYMLSLIHILFTSWGKETVKIYSQDEIKSILDTLSNDESYGMILRAKGMVEGKDGQWIYFDMVPGEAVSYTHLDVYKRQTLHIFLM